MNLLAAVILAQVAATGQRVEPVLAFPEPGLDDTTAYQGYRTRFLRDAAGNAVQVYINQREGRIVHLWADAANASAGFTARHAQGRPAPLTWGSDGATVGMSNGTRFVEYRLAAEPGPIELGAFLLGSMRLERDFQYQKGHLEPFGEGEARQPELEALIAHVERLGPPERSRHLALLRAASTAELRSRLRPTIRQTGPVVQVEQATFDGRNGLSLELTIEHGQASVDAAKGSVTILPRSDRAVELVVRATTDAPVLSPLEPDEIFNADFWRFFDRLREASADALRFRRVDRQVRSAELVSYEEKLMAGLPNFATYFGRDMIMSALMMEPVWTEAMLEHVIASVLRKLRATGEVSHEEALGGQAIRENGAEYNVLMDEELDVRRGGDTTAADSLLVRAHAVLSDLQRVRENYHMVDDDFQFPVLVARYLANSAIAADRRRALLEGREGPNGETRLQLLLRNLAFVAREATPYAGAPVATNLVSFARRPDGRWASSSWRDSNAGYGGGRFAMDVNAIWVPAALAATGDILSALERLGWSAASLAGQVPGPDGAALRALILGRDALDSTLDVWRGARRHFEVEVPPRELRHRTAGWLGGLPDAEGAYWGARVDTEPAAGLRFLALSLDSAGHPIPVINTDPGMEWFLEDVTGQVLRGELDPADAIARLEPFVLDYPLGLFVPGLGPLVANDALAGAEVRQAFRADTYHSPRVVWGREVNLLLLGLTRQIAAAYDSTGRLESPALTEYAPALARALVRTRNAVESSGLKHHELWSYRIEGARLTPVRYPTSTDIQLWNVTDLAVQHALTGLPEPVARMLMEPSR
jgi:hypothetical protein